MGELYTPEEEEDLVVQQVTNLHFPLTRYRVALDKVGAGNIVLIEGVDESLAKTGTLRDAEGDMEFDIFMPINFNSESVMKLALEPLNPSELPKLIESLRKANKSYPLLQTRVEQSGEHVVVGTGELYLDSVLHDVRNVFGDIEVKVSEPYASFHETVLDASSIKCTVESSNKKNTLSMICEPLDKGLAEHITAGNTEQLPKLLVEEF